MTWTPEERQAARPPERITLSKHTEQVLTLDKNSAIQGLFMLDMVPFWGPVMDACSDSRWDEITVMAAAQMGKTTSLVVAVVVYYGRQEPAAVGVVLADQTTSEYIMTERLQPAFRDSADLAPIYDPKAWTKREATLKTGGYIGIAWASSVASIATRAFRVMISDEIDKPGYNLKSKEAPAMSLIGERTKSFPIGFFKQIRMSTPTTENGNCALKFEETKAVFDWHARCPYCGQRQPLKWSPEYAFGFEKGEYRAEDSTIHKLGKVVWEGGRNATNEQIQETARYECGECQQLWTNEDRKTAANIANGKMVSRHEFSPLERRMCVQVSRLVSQFDSGALAVLVEDFCRIMRMPDGPERVEFLQGFINSSLGEPFRLTGTDRTADAILALADNRPPGVLPGGGVVAGLIAGADTQGDDESGGFWYELRGFGYGPTQPSWGIRRGWVETKAALIEILKETYLDSDGVKYQVTGCGIDAMGHRTKEIYDFAREHRSLLYPIKGEQSMKSYISFSNLEYYPGKKKRKIPGGLQLMSVNTTYFKNGLFQKLQISPADPGAWLYDSGLTEEWAKMMVAEYRDANGIWQEIRSRPNHGWDVSDYLMAMAEYFQFALKQPPEPVKIQPVREEEPNPYTDGAAFSWN